MNIQDSPSSERARQIKKILLLEDYAPSRELILETLQYVFGDVAITEHETISGALESVAHTDYDLAILDLNLPDGSGVEVIGYIRAQCPETYCVVATVFDDDQNLFESLKAGAHGYLLKQEARKDFERHLHGILTGEPPLSAKMAQKMIAHFSVANPAPSKIEAGKLTHREEQVLHLIAQGASRKRIALDLDISLHTTNDYVKTIYRKLNVSSRVEATLVAIEKGIA